MVLVKTDKGQQVMKDRSVALTPRQRSAFILFDGQRSTREVLAATAAMGVVAADIDQLLGQGLLREAVGAASADPAAAPAAVGEGAPPAAPATAVPPAAGVGPGIPGAGGSRSPQQRYMEAYPIATALTAGLGLRGFRLNPAVEAAGNLDELLLVAPRIREAVGAEKYAALERALQD